VIRAIHDRVWTAYFYVGVFSLSAKKEDYEESPASYSLLHQLGDNLREVQCLWRGVPDVWEWFRATRDEPEVCEKGWLIEMDGPFASLHEFAWNVADAVYWHMLHALTNDDTIFGCNYPVIERDDLNYRAAFERLIELLGPDSESPFAHGRNFDFDIGRLRIEAAKAACMAEAYPLPALPADAQKLIDTPRRSMSIEEANEQALIALRDPDCRTVRKLAERVGCSTGLVCELPAWRAYQDKLKRENPRAPRAVSLTDAVLAKEDRDDEELARLIAEQTADLEESPLISSARKLRPRRRTV
jgi:hypothetical protein